MAAAKNSARKFPTRIVAGVEDDARSDDAVDAAIAIARRFDVRLELVHAFPEVALDVLPHGGLPPGTLDADAERAILSRLSTRVRTVLASLEDDPKPPRLQLIAGSPAQVLLERVRAIDADLVVLGPHRQRRALDFGSTTRALLAEGPRGVWTQVGPWRPIERILAPIDVSSDSLHALSIARDLAQGFGARVVVMHCFLVPALASEPVTDASFPTPGYSLEALRDASREEFERAVGGFDWRGVAHEARFEEGDPVTIILELQARADLIVLGTHGRTGLAAALLGNVAAAVMKDAMRPVLAIRRTLRDL